MEMEKLDTAKTLIHWNIFIIQSNLRSEEGSGLGGGSGESFPSRARL